MLRIAVRFEDHALFFRPPAEHATLGAAEGNNWVVPFPGVSRRHAVVRRHPVGIHLQDLGSKNGLLRGDQRYSEIVLAPGDALQIGRAELRLEEMPSSDGEIVLRLPPATPPPLRRVVDGATDSLRARTGEATPGGALALVRRLERADQSSSRPLSESKLLGEARATLAAEGLVLLALRDDGEPAVLACDGRVADAASLRQLAARAADVSSKEDSWITLPEGSTALARRATGSDGARVLVALLHQELGKPLGWKLDFFDYLTEKLAPAGRTGRSPEEPGGPSDDPLRLPTDFVHGGSASISGLLESLRATVRSSLDVLILGETGVGKELVARCVHASGPSSKGPFVAVNCAAIPSDLLEAELFGVEARVATGVDPRPGLFVRAEGGSLFLDEIGDMPEALQAKLLRVLQEREVLAVGAHQPRKVQVRVISASNKELARRVAEGSFRADLYYRLKGLQFHVPPLRERCEDLPALVLAFTTRAAESYGKRILGVSRRALDLLSAYGWPGNLRELKNEVERAVLLAPNGSSLESDHFGTIRYAVEQASGPETTAGTSTAGEAQRETRQDPHEAPSGTLQIRLDEVERDAIRDALHACMGNKSQAARLLGITRNGLALKMKRLGLDS